MYVRGYLQGSENGRVVTIGCWLVQPTNQISDINAYAHSWIPLLPFVNIDKTNTEKDRPRAFAYLENKYNLILIIKI